MYKGHKIAALCLTKINDERNTDIVRKLNDALRSRGYSLFVYSACSDFYWNNRLEAGERHVYELMDYNIVDAVIVFSETFKDLSVAEDICRTARKNGKPVVTLGGAFSGCVNFSFDYSAGFESVVRHIISDHNIKDTVMMAGVKGEPNSEDRIAAYKKVLAENGLPFSDDMIFYGDYWSGPTESETLRIINSGHIPGAVICANDMMAITVCSVFQRSGYSVPEDVAVTGFDGIDEARQYVPPITTCKCSHTRTVSAIAECISDMAEGKSVPENSRIPYIIDIYSSCGCHPERAPYNLGYMLKAVADRFNRYQDDNATFCEITQELAAEADLGDLSKCLSKYNFYDTCIFVKKSFCDEKVNPLNETWNGFEDEVRIIYCSGRHDESYPAVFMRSDIIPDIDMELERGNPLIFSILSFFGIPVGYVCFHFSIDTDNYCKIPQFVYSLDNALSGFRNIMHLKYAASSLEKSSESDYMTGLYNRNGFYKALSKLISEHSDSDFAVASVDMDGLKYINDRFGHNEGDFAISSIAAAIRELPLKDKICGRFGGDEFVICALKTSGDEERLIREHIAGYLANIVKESGVPYNITVSIGTCCSEGKPDFDGMLKVSDENMYAEKNAKPNRRK